MLSINKRTCTAPVLSFRTDTNFEFGSLRPQARMLPIEPPLLLFFKILIDYNFTEFDSLIGSRLLCWVAGTETTSFALWILFLVASDGLYFSHTSLLTFHSPYKSYLCNGHSSFIHGFHHIFVPKRDSIHRQQMTLFMKQMLYWPSHHGCIALAIQNGCFILFWMQTNLLDWIYLFLFCCPKQEN